MKKKVFYVLAMVAIVAVASVNVLNLRTSTSTGNLYLANLMALSDDNEGGGGGETEWWCGGNPTYIPFSMLLIMNCPNVTHTYKGCSKPEFLVKVCCNPADQTVCL